jgi:restriction system protein
MSALVAYSRASRHAALARARHASTIAPIMARRDSHILVELTELPWWASVAVAAFVYFAIHSLVPALAGSSKILGPLAHAFAGVAGWFALIFLIPLPFALLNASRRRSLVEGQMSIERIRALSWQQFEQLVGEAYRRQGYSVTERGGPQADGGIDLELRTPDKLLVVQCKHWKAQAVAVRLVRELYGAMAGAEANAAIFVTSGRYTPDAIDFARNKPIKLIDRRGLVELLRGSVVAEQPAPRVTASPSDAQSSARSCPRCGSDMRKRVAKRGAERGEAFWGCSRYPKCHGTRPA